MRTLSVIADAMPAPPPFGSAIFPRPGEGGPERGRLYLFCRKHEKSSPEGRADSTYGVDGEGYSRLCRLQKRLLTQYIAAQSRMASTRKTGFFIELTSDWPNRAIMATIMPLPSSMVTR